MERTLDIMEAELKALKEQFKPLAKKLAELESEIEEYKLENTLYHSMSELVNYRGKQIRSITLIERDEDGTLDTDFVYDDEIFEIDDDGHLYYSSYSGGIIKYDNKAEKYVHMYYGHPEYHDYVGFMEIDIRD